MSGLKLYLVPFRAPSDDSFDPALPVHGIGGEPIAIGNTPKVTAMDAARADGCRRTQQEGDADMYGWVLLQVEIVDGPSCVEWFRDRLRGYQRHSVSIACWPWPKIFQGPADT